MEGDYEREQTPKILLAGAYSYNDRALRAQGSNGDKLLFDQTRNLSSYFVDFIFKYQGFAFYTDFMDVRCHEISDRSQIKSTSRPVLQLQK